MNTRDLENYAIELDVIYNNENHRDYVAEKMKTLTNLSRSHEKKSCQTI